MELKSGYFYFLADGFFEKVNDPFLKREHTGTKRPHYLAIQDKTTSLYWIVPCSSQVEKYESIIADRQARHKPTDTIKIVKVQDRKEALLFQDMFPVSPAYIQEQYIRGDQPVYIADPKVVAALEKNAKRVVNLIRHGVKFTPTQPDALRVEKIILAGAEPAKGSIPAWAAQQLEGDDLEI